MIVERIEPYHCLRPGGEQRQPTGPRIGPVPEDQTENREERSILCRACSHAVTSSRFAAEVDGKHEHTFFNPAGIIFEIRCFSDAPGCLSLGEASTYFSWFEGCAWRYAICGGCQAHLGWEFLRQGGGSFFGLISNRLTDSDS